MPAAAYKRCSACKALSEPAAPLCAGCGAMFPAVLHAPPPPSNVFRPAAPVRARFEMTPELRYGLSGVGVLLALFFAAWGYVSYQRAHSLIPIPTLPPSAPFALEDYHETPVFNPRPIPPTAFHPPVFSEIPAPNLGGRGGRGMATPPPAQHSERAVFANASDKVYQPKTPPPRKRTGFGSE